MMNVSSIENTYVQQTTELNEAQVKSTDYSRVALGIVKRITACALPAIALYAMSNVPLAEAGPGAYLVCVTLCCGTYPPLIPVLFPSCSVGCAPFGVAPTL